MTHLRRLVIVHAVAALAAASLLAARAPAQPAPRADTGKPHVLLVATGGTISNRTGGRLTAQELVDLIPDAARYAQVGVEQFSNVASSQLSLDQYLALSRRINEAYRGDPALAGVVVTMGTDTMEELAYFLHLTVRDERPVVVVGAMRNASQVGYEGPANLLEGIRVAADPDARGMGTMVVLNDEINSAREVTKTDARRLHTFQSRGYGVLGVIDNDRVAWYRRTVKRHSAASEFDVFAIKALPRVDVLMVYQDAPADLIKAAVDHGALGVVLATAGGGATSGTQGEGILYAAEKQVFVVSSTRTGGGRIWPFQGAGQGGPPETAARRRFLLAAEDLMPVKARVLLMLGLATSSDRDQLQRMFDQY